MSDISAQQPLPGARKALVLLLAINLLNYLDRYVLAAVEIPVRNEFGLNKTQSGWLLPAFMLAYILASPVFGWLADRWRRWTIIAIGVLVWSLASGGTGLAWSYLALLFMRVMVGVGEAAYGPAAPALLSDLYPVEQRGKVLAWFYAAIPVGSALGYVLGGLFAKPELWHWAFILTVPPGLVAAWFAFRMRGTTADKVTSIASRRAAAADYVALLRNRSYVLNTLGMTAMTFAIGGIAFWMPTYLIEERGQRADVTGTMFGAISALAGLTATLAGGWLGDKLRRRGVRGSYLVVSAGGMFVGFPLLLLMLVTPFPLNWLVIFAAVFCLFFNTGPSNAALANVTRPEVRASAFAANILVIHLLGDVISPPIMGKIADHWSLAVSIVVVSFMVVVGGLLWLAGAYFLDRDTSAAS